MACNDQLCMYQPFSIVNLFLTYRKGTSKSDDVLFVFLLFEKMDHINCIKCLKAFDIWTVAFGESAMSRIQVRLWYNRFREDWEDVNDDASLGRPSLLTTDENIEGVKKMILDN